MFLLNENFGSVSKYGDCFVKNSFFILYVTFLLDAFHKFCEVGCCHIQFGEWIQKD